MTGFSTLENRRRSLSVKRSLQKGRLISIVRRTLHLRRPTHKRASSTGYTGFIYPGDIGTGLGTPSASTIFRPVSSDKSVHSVQVVDVFGSQPHIFLTLPSHRGRRSHMIHRGRDNSDMSSVRSGAKNLRFSHPTVSLTVEPRQCQSEPSICSSSTSPSIPAAVDLARQFPNQVNIWDIADQAKVSLDDAKLMVDGISHPTAWASARNREDETIKAHRLDALAALTDGANTQAVSLPSTLRPGLVPVETRPSIAPWEDQTTHIDRVKVLRPRYAPRDSLGYIPYSTFFNRAPSPPEKKPFPDCLPTALSLRHRQLYTSVEGLSDSFPAFDAALKAAEMAYQDKVAANKPPVIPEPFLMVDNGYPMLTAPSSHAFAAATSDKKHSVDLERVHSWKPITAPSSLTFAAATSNKKQSVDHEQVHPLKHTTAPPSLALTAATTSKKLDVDHERVRSWKHTKKHKSQVPVEEYNAVKSRRSSFISRLHTSLVH